VIIYDLNVVSIAISPRETNAPLVIDSNAVLAGPIATEFFEAIGRWRSKVS
jgi:hypothetical protein